MPVERHGQSSIQSTQYERPLEWVNLLRVGELAVGKSLGSERPRLCWAAVSPTCLTCL